MREGVAQYGQERWLYMVVKWPVSILSSSTPVLKHRQQPDPTFSWCKIIVPIKIVLVPDIIYKQKEIQTDVPGLLEVAGGLNFVNDEDSFPPLEKHDPIVNNIMDEYLKLSHLKKYTMLDRQRTQYSPKTNPDTLLQTHLQLEIHWLTCFLA